jgi:hypothetical protein
MSDAPIPKKRARAVAVKVPPEPAAAAKKPKKPKTPKEPKEPKTNYLRTLNKDDIELRKNAKIDELKAKTDEKIRYADVREKQKEINLIEKARLKRLNPTAFASENKAVFDMTGQKAADTPEELDNKQRKETIRALGRLSYSAEPKNFVVEKPLKPNAMDIYQAKKIQQRDAIRNQRAFVPVQKL